MEKYFCPLFYVLNFQLTKGATLKRYFVIAMIAVGINGCGGGSDSTAQTPPTPSIVVSDRATFEPGGGSSALSFTVTLSQASSNNITVDYATADGTALAGADYSSANGSLSFSAGETSKTISVNVLSDTPYNESEETFSLALSNPVNATLAVAQASATIVDKVSNPDTGITSCANETSNSLGCAQPGFDQQDAEFGLDNSNNNNADGRAGFSFTKLDSAGAALAAGAVSWNCVRDETTGLVWEVRPDDGGIRDRDSTFAWYNPDGSTNGGNAGSQSGGACTGGINCNTSAYVAAVNTAGLCGANDWRMPTAMELLTLHDYGSASAPGIDTNYFNDLVISNSLKFWASDTDASDATNAWVVFFSIGSAGESSVGSKSSLPSLVRLVRKP